MAADELPERRLVEPVQHVAEPFIVIAPLGKIGAVGLVQSANKSIAVFLANFRALVSVSAVVFGLCPR